MELLVLFLVSCSKACPEDWSEMPASPGICVVMNSLVSKVVFPCDVQCIVWLFKGPSIICRIDLLPQSYIASW